MSFLADEYHKLKNKHDIKVKAAKEAEAREFAASMRIARKAQKAALKERERQALRLAVKRERQKVLDAEARVKRAKARNKAIKAWAAKTGTSLARKAGRELFGGPKRSGGRRKTKRRPTKRKRGRRR